MAVMYEWFDNVGYDVNTDELRKDYPEVGCHTLEQWTNQQDFS